MIASVLAGTAGGIRVESRSASVWARRRTMDEGWERKVRERAYAVWEQQGRPEGHAERFWDMAERQLLGEGHRPGEATDRARADQIGAEAVEESSPAGAPPAWTR